jgi:hypothetical protein
LLLMLFHQFGKIDLNNKTKFQKNRFECLHSFCYDTTSLVENTTKKKTK